ncbi:unnamed protein product [Cuscuta europaea]|uniref:Uncharacterized protein n=1 Tax=Cuscuta europaea TaxID=41803 RepID=A0A9P1DZB5_CUSEU|nr:unnamed protein product [Cuscuta europaea]
MECALVSASAILPLTKDVGVVSMTCQSSLFGNSYNGFIVRRNLSSAGIRSPLTVTSVFRRKTKKQTIVPDPDYRIPVVLLGTAGCLIYTNNLLAAAPAGLLGLLLLFQMEMVFPYADNKS